MTPEPYPIAHRDAIVDDLHGTQVPDPYRWLENPEDAETRRWLREQGELFERESGPQRFKERIGELLRSGSVGTPAWRGDRHFFSRRTPDQEHAVFYVVDADGTERALIDPMALDPSGLTTLDAVQPGGDHAGEGHVRIGARIR